MGFTLMDKSGNGISGERLDLELDHEIGTGTVTAHGGLPAVPPTWAEGVMARDKLAGTDAARRGGSAAARHRVVLVGGLLRVGKSQLAMSVAAEMDARHVKIDKLRKHFVHVENSAQRRAARVGAYLKVIAAAAETGRTTVIEGADLIFQDLSAGPDSDRLLDITLLRFLMDYLGCAAVLVGPGPREIAERKAGAISDHALRAHDWVFKLSDGDPETIHKKARAIAKRLILRSARLRKIAARNGIDYLEIDTDSFEEDLARAVRHVREMIHPPE